jgi:hypothetical protein
VDYITPKKTLPIFVLANQRRGGCLCGHFFLIAQKANNIAAQVKMQFAISERIDRLKEVVAGFVKKR